MLTAEEIVCDAAMYDKAQEEIFRLMSRDPYPRFLKSDLAVTYAKIARGETGENLFVTRHETNK
jgi:hypothetical protein